MDGRRVIVCAAKEFDFDGLTSGQSQILTVMERIAAAGYEKVDLLVRVHETSTISTNGSVAVQIVADGFTADDPSQDFFSAVIGGQAPISFSAGTIAAGTFRVATLSGDLGARIAVQVVGTGGSTDAALRLSIELVFKGCR